MSIEKHEYEYLLKFKLLGDSGVGKSALLLRFADGTFTESYIASIGVDFKIKTIDTDYGICKLNIWDTAGNERYRSRHNNNRSHHAAIIAFDLTNPESFNNIQKWIEEVKSVSESAPIIIVGTKSDLVNERKIDKNDALEFCDQLELPYFETSAFSDEGVKELFIETANNVCSKLENASDHRDINKKNNQIFENYIKEIKENCARIRDTHPEQRDLKNDMLEEIKTIRLHSTKELYAILNKYSNASKKINSTENTGFFSTSKSELSIVCDNLAEKISNIHKIPSPESQQEAKVKNYTLIQEVVTTITEKFGAMGEVNGKQMPLGGSLFTGIFGKEPSLGEQKLRVDMIRIAEKYKPSSLDSATQSLARLKKDLNTFPTQHSESIAKGKADVLAVANETNYPIWLIALFCIPVLGQIGWGMYELIKCCLPDPEREEPSNRLNII
ncbi:MAG: GTP-binding protein [Tatlockia sp.]|nr:GTP-binding protein [Tatlockia sp.]